MSDHSIIYGVGVGVCAHTHTHTGILFPVYHTICGNSFFSTRYVVDKYDLQDVFLEEFCSFCYMTAVGKKHGKKFPLWNLKTVFLISGRLQLTRMKRLLCFLVFLSKGTFAAREFPDWHSLSYSDMEASVYPKCVLANSGLIGSLIKAHSILGAEIRRATDSLCILRNMQTEQ